MRNIILPNLQNILKSTHMSEKILKYDFDLVIVTTKQKIFHCCHVATKKYLQKIKNWVEIIKGFFL